MTESPRNAPLPPGVYRCPKCAWEVVVSATDFRVNVVEFVCVRCVVALERVEEPAKEGAKP
jgi:hypothetical protein